jgi:hypothetical protein
MPSGTVVAQEERAQGDRIDDLLARRTRRVLDGPRGRR